MKQLKLKSSYKKILADTISPVSIYLRLRDRFSETILLESSEYQNNRGGLSYICFSPLAELKIHHEIIRQTILDETADIPLGDNADIPKVISRFTELILTEALDLNFLYSGSFGYTSFEAAQYFDTIQFNNSMPPEKDIPSLLYRFYQYIIVFDHFKKEVFIINHSAGSDQFDLDYLAHFITSAPLSEYAFSRQNSERCNNSPNEFLEMVRHAKDHCARGDVFQLVLSRCFSQSFSGDDFNVYRALRCINPSPYMFYFDYGSFRLMGSSPEAQLVVDQDSASIHPIAGTYRRTGDLTKDIELAEQLKKDPKENAEHVMLVDLARNDLSIHGDHVQVETFSEIQMYSHVIHLVSKVSAKINNNPIQIYADTFPAGTLSGAPKYKAMELINKYENEKRSFYGGAIGIFGQDQSINHAIMIRTFLSKDNILSFQAGAGLVIDSDPEKELKEVDNKLAALRRALSDAEKINT